MKNGLKKKTNLYGTKKTFTSDLKKHTLNMKEQKKIVHANRSANRAGVEILKLDKIEFKTKNLTRDS